MSLLERFLNTPGKARLEVRVKLGVANDTEKESLKLDPLISACKEGSLVILKSAISNPELDLGKLALRVELSRGLVPGRGTLTWFAFDRQREGPGSGEKRASWRHRIQRSGGCLSRKSFRGCMVA